MWYDMLTKTRIYAHHDRGLRQGHINFLMSCHYFGMVMLGLYTKYWLRIILDSCGSTSIGKHTMEVHKKSPAWAELFEIRCWNAQEMRPAKCFTVRTSWLT